jgi:1,4-alpha-glucan branching enzyme
MRYAFDITGGGVTRRKSDPFARGYEQTSGRASVIMADGEYPWGDGEWMSKRSRFSPDRPMNIYLIHTGSWRTRDGKSTSNGKGYLNYRELAEELRDYLLDMGYTHVQLMPVCEYPKDSSFGYGATGYFAPTSRHGSFEDFKFFVDTLHRAGLGVILEWNPISFAKDASGLCEFDGGVMFEIKKGRGQVCRFDLLRPDVRSFLLSSAMLWLRELHVDGLAVRTDGVNLRDAEREAASSFFAALNGAVHGEETGAFTVLCEPRLQAAVPSGNDDGKFDLLWNTPLIEGLLDCVSAEPYVRHKKHTGLTFSSFGGVKEEVVLPLAVRGSLTGMIYGSYEDKFATQRAVFGYMMTCAGKKLIFMGSEFGQLHSWDHENQLDWFLEDAEAHRALKNYVRALNKYYLKKRALWDGEGGAASFRWIYSDRADDNLIAFKRIGKGGSELVCTVNFSPCEYPSYRLFVGDRYAYCREEFNSDRVEFGGKGRENRGLIEVRDSFAALRIPPLSLTVLTPVIPDTSAEVTVEISPKYN